jgi:hypothetical protein
VRRRLSVGTLWFAAHAALAPAALLTSFAAPGVAAQVNSSGFGIGAQAPVGDWNDTQAREIVSRAIERRASWTGDDELSDYRARALGHIYFLYDMGRTTERHLVKADQLALDLFWRVPDQTRQLLIGRRERKVLPTNIRYHLDHLTVVMDNFGDRIYLGEGSEVKDALHPAAPGALAFYEYRVTDSLTLHLAQRETQVYKIEMRPRDPSQPGLVGAMYLDRTSADIVRMEFTFTAASYLDDTLDYFNVRLENALWDGRYWLPYRQGIELRREVRFLEFPAGGIIRAEFRISDYRFNTGTPEAYFRGPSVVALPPDRRDDFVFEDGLYDALDPDIAVAPPSLDEIREEASQMVAESYLKQAERLKLAVPGASSVLRFRRAEGLYVGPGINRGFPQGNILILGGYAIGQDRWQLEVSVRVTNPSGSELELVGYVDRTADVGPWKPSSGAVASFAALFDGEDHREPYWMRGGLLRISQRLGAARANAAVAWQTWKPASLTADAVIDRSYRPVRQLDEGEVLLLKLGLDRPAVAAVEEVGGAKWEAWVEGASRSVGGDFGYVYGAARAEQLWPTTALGVGVRLSGAVGGVGGDRIPAERLFPLGGRGSVRGFSFHRFVGNLYAMGSIELSRAIRPPFLSASLFSDIGWVGIEGSSADRAVGVWNQVGAPAGATRGPQVGVGASLGLAFNILWLDVARGLGEEGIWEVVFRVRSEFWGWL